MSQFIEVVKFLVAADAAPAFIKGRSNVDAALSLFNGFLGSELCVGADDIWTLFVRWASEADVKAAQAITLSSPGLPELSSWLTLTKEFKSFETVEVQYVSYPKAA
jgi:hypothetical protein